MEAATQNGDLEERIIELESRITWQDDTLRVLDEAVVSQRQELDLLKTQVAWLKQQLWQLSGVTGLAAETPPPHY